MRASRAGRTPGGNFETTAAEIEREDVGVGLVSGVGADTRRGEPGFDFTGDDGQRHAGGGLHLAGEILAADGLAHGAGGEQAAAGRPQRTGISQQPADGRDRLGARFDREWLRGTSLRLETDSLGLSSEFVAVGGGDDRDLDGVGAYVDDGDDGHVQKRN